MELNLTPGLVCVKEELVTEENIALKYGSGNVSVYATPAMIGLMEFAALSCVDHLLGDGMATVGSHLDVKHLAATPVGDKVQARAELLEVVGRKLVFKVEAFDSKDKIGEGTHERFVINLAKFLAKVEEKKAK